MVAVLGADSPIGLTVIRELGEHGIPVLALGRTCQSLGRHSRYASSFAKFEQPLDEWLPRFLTDHRLSAILGISEGDLLQLARLKGRLGATKVMCPDPDKLAIVLDKRRTLEVAAQIGIKVPRSWLPRRGEDHAARAAQLDYPVAVKWSDPPSVVERLKLQGLELEKVELAENPGELMAILDRYQPLGEWPLAQTWCPGYGLGQMLNMHGGRATLTFQHRRLREWPPSGGVSSLCEAVPLKQHREQMALSERLLKEIGWEGPAMVEYRYDPSSDTYWLMEVNGRFWGSMPLAHYAGAHFAWEYYRCQTQPEAECIQPATRKIRARYVAPDFKHLLAVLGDSSRSAWRRLRFAMRFFADFADPRVRYYVWSWRDPLPFLSEMGGIVRKLLRRDTHREGR